MKRSHPQGPLRLLQIEIRGPPWIRRPSLVCRHALEVRSLRPNGIPHLDRQPKTHTPICLTITRAARLASIARTLDATQSSIPRSGLVRSWLETIPVHNDQQILHPRGPVATLYMPPPNMEMLLAGELKESIWARESTSPARQKAPAMAYEKVLLPLLRYRENSHERADFDRIMTSESRQARC